jgi:molybdate transport system regulatory protein
MILSARNVIEGTVTDIKLGQVAAEVQVDIGSGKTITSTITVNSTKRLDLEVGKTVSVIIKASDVIVAVDD